jgi:septal ring factor EnvC (AmiA/AmiB activator)
LTDQSLAFCDGLNLHLLFCFRALRETQDAIAEMERKKAEIEQKALELEQTVTQFTVKSEATEAELVERQVSWLESARFKTRVSNVLFGAGVCLCNLQILTAVQRQDG